MKHLRAVTLDQKQDVGIQGVMNVASVVDELWERTADRLTPAELEWFAGAGEIAAMELQNLEDVIDGIGCFVINDTPNENGSRLGHLQDAQGLSSLLFSLSNSVRNARALLTVSDAANSRLKNPDMFNRAD